MEPEPFINADQVAKHFGVEPRTVTTWRKRLGLPAHRFSKGRRGGLVLFKLSEVLLWAEQFRQDRKPLTRRAA